MSNKHKEHDENCGCSQELDGLLGMALTTKLMLDTAQTVNDAEKAINQVLLDSIKIRQGLVADELTHLKPKDCEEALLLLKQKHLEMLSCVAMRLAAMVGNSLDGSIASFVGHAANHFEIERSRSVIERMFGSARENSAQQIKDAAAAVTGTDN